MINDKKELFEWREKVNDKMKKLRQELKLGRTKGDLQRVKTLIKKYKSNEVSLIKTMSFIKLLMEDKWLAGIRVTLKK